LGWSEDTYEDKKKLLTLFLQTAKRVFDEIREAIK